MIVSRDETSATDSVEQVYSIDDEKLDLSSSSEKVDSFGVDEVKKTSQESFYDGRDSEDTLFVKGEPVIQTGLDVSRYAVDIRDDHDPSLTFRSLFLGTCFGALGATLGEVSPFLSHSNISLIRGLPASFSIALHV